MKLFRFMSSNEFDKYLVGEKLVNTTDHRKKHSNSVGFCFFEYLDLNDDDSLDGISPEYAIEFMSGVATMDVVAVFETDKELTRSCGRYADPYGGWFDTIWLDEYCIDEYDNKSFHLIKWGAIGKYADSIVWDNNLKRD